MKWTEIQTGKTHSAFQHFMVALGDEAEVAVDRMNNESDSFAQRLAIYAINGGVEPTTSQKRAREIMGKSMFGVEEAIQHFGVNPTRRQFAVLLEIPFTEDVLKKCKDTHLLVAVFPMSILDIRKKVQGKGLLDNQAYEKEAFAEEQGEIGWQLVRKTPVDNSASKNWEEQLALIGEEDEVSTAQVMLYTIIGRCLATGERLFEHIYVRTSSVASDGDHVSVGYFGSIGLCVSYDWDGCRNDDIAVASVRKF